MKHTLNDILELFNTCTTHSAVETLYNDLVKLYDTDTATSEDKSLMVWINHSHTLALNRVRKGNETFVYSTSDNTTILSLTKAYDEEMLPIPNGVTSIADGAFWVRDDGGVSNPFLMAETVVLPHTVTSIGPKAFKGARRVQEVIFEHEDQDTLTIGPAAFLGTSIKSIALPLQTTYVHTPVQDNQYGVFTGAKLQRILFPLTDNSKNHIATWGLDAIEEIIVASETVSGLLNGMGEVANTTLKKVSIHPKTTTLPEGFFNNCLELRIVEGIEHIEDADKAFIHCPKMKLDVIY